MGRIGMFLSVIAIAAGAVMHWAVTTTGHGFNVSTVGIILLVVGAVGLVASTIIFAISRRPAGGTHHSYDRETVDAQGRSTEVHEKVA